MVEGDKIAVAVVATVVMVANVLIVGGRGVACSAAKALAASGGATSGRASVGVAEFSAPAVRASACESRSKAYRLALPGKELTSAEAVCGVMREGGG